MVSLVVYFIGASLLIYCMSNLKIFAPAMTRIREKIKKLGQKLKGASNILKKSDSKSGAEQENDDLVVVNNFWVKIRILVDNKMINTAERGYLLHNLAENPVVTFRETYFKGSIATKIVFKDADHCYSPTSVDKLQTLLGIDPLLFYGSKTVDDQIEEKEEAEKQKGK